MRLPHYIMSAINEGLKAGLINFDRQQAFSKSGNVDNTSLQYAIADDYINDFLRNPRVFSEDMFVKILNLKGYQYKVKTTYQLASLVQQIVKIDNKANLNWIDISELTDLSSLFSGSSFNGDISEWDVSNIETTDHMFAFSKFNNDISKWKFKNIKSMYGMFKESEFNRPQDLTNWDIDTKIVNTTYMFYRSKIEANDAQPEWYYNF